jgi:hypothetical protein
VLLVAKVLDDIGIVEVLLRLDEVKVSVKYVVLVLLSVVADTTVVDFVGIARVIGIVVVEVVFEIDAVEMELLVVEKLEGIVVEFLIIVGIFMFVALEVAELDEVIGVVDDAISVLLVDAAAAAVVVVVVVVVVVGVVLLVVVVDVVELVAVVGVVVLVVEVGVVAFIFVVGVVLLLVVVGVAILDVVDGVIVLAVVVDFLCM